MKYCVGVYEYKGFSIMFSEYYQEWVIDPSFLFKDFSTYEENIITDYICNYGRDFILNCKTLKECKSRISDFIKADGKEKIKNDFLSKINN